MSRSLLMTTIILAVTILVGCGAKEETVKGVVEEVRITSSVVSGIDSSGDAVGGAIAGGLIAGPVGAVVGAAIGSSGSHTIVQGELLACKFIAQVENRSVAFTFTGNWSSTQKASLLRKGDRINIRKLTWASDEPYESYNEKIEYRWYYNNNNNSFKKGEILPR